MRRKARTIVNVRMSIERSRKDGPRGDRKLSLSTLPLAGCWWFSGLFQGMFLEFLSLFMGKSEWAVVKPHKRLAWIRHLSGSAGDRGIRFAAFVGIRNALMMIIDISNHIKG